MKLGNEGGHWYEKRFFTDCYLILCLVLCSCAQSEQGNRDVGNTNQQGKSDLPEAIINNMTGDEGYYDIEVEEKKLSIVLEQDEFVLGAHYDGEDRVWLIGNIEGNVYAYKAAQEKTLLLEGISPTYVRTGGSWWKAGERFFINGGRFLVALKANGELVFRINLGLGQHVQDICVTESGRIAVAMYKEEDIGVHLMELDIRTGELLEKTTWDSYFGMAGGMSDGVMMMTEVGLYTYDLESGECNWHLKWGGSTYHPGGGNATVDIRLSDNGKVVLLAENVTEAAWYEETLSKVAFEDIDETLLVYKTLYASSQLKELVARFNKQSEVYYIYLDERKTGTDAKDFYEKTAIEIATRKGPDIIDMNSVEDIYAMAQKGALEDLESYLQNAGINKDDYFSVAFCDLDMEEKCYGLGYACSVRSMYMKEEIAEDAVDIESLLENLAAYEEAAVFNDLYDYYPTTLLHYFLYMSEDFYGMLDWENGTCKFDTELWYSMLEIAKRYGKDEQKVGLEDIATPVFGSTSKIFVLDDTEARNQGMVPVGYPTEDTMIHGMQVDCICMNATSEQKEGVWEFMQFLLTEQSQQKLSELYVPVLKSEFEKDYQRDLTNPGVVMLMDRTTQKIQPEQIEQFAEQVKSA